MNNRETPEQVKPLLPGDKVLRIRKRKPRRRLRIAPDMPGIVRFLRQIVAETPLIPLLLVLISLWLLASLGIYLVERGTDGQFTSYGAALWWSFTAMQTQGANIPGPVTATGQIIGAIWSIFSTIAFFGVIIATIYAYYMLPKRRPTREVVGALQYNLDELENLTVEELEVLRDTTVKIVNSQISKLTEKPANQKDSPQMMDGKTQEQDD
jgi:voltage-gated potassium channel